VDIILADLNTSTKSLLLQSENRSFISPTVPFDLCFPEDGVEPWQMSTTRTSVPETPVHKYREVLSRKKEIRVSDHPLRPDPPSLYTSPDKGQPQSSFCCSIVSSTDGLHGLGSLKGSSLKLSIR
jgi:hypothetical protein